MKTSCATRSEQATTLMELVTASGIVAIIAATMIGSFNHGFFTLERVRENQRATQILIEKVETIRLYSWDQINTSGFIPSAFTDKYDPQGAPGAQGITYTGTVTITNTPFATSYTSNIRELIVTLQWTNSRHQTSSRTLCTLVAKDGIQNYVY